MKKILTLLLLIFPILIFAILNVSATLVAWMVPQPAEKVEVASDGVHFDEKKYVSYSKVEPDLVYEMNYKVGPQGSRDKEVEAFASDESLVQIINVGTANDEGIGKISYKILNYGFSEITVKSKDGGYKANMFITVKDNTLSKKHLQGAVFEFNQLSDGMLQFGYNNDVIIDFRYYPESLNKEDLIKDGKSYEMSEFATIIEAENGIGRIRIDLSLYNSKYPEKTTYDLYFKRDANNDNGDKKAKLNVQFEMNINPGINLRYYPKKKIGTESFKQQNQIMKTYLKGDLPVYQLDDILIEEQLVISNDVLLYGNHKTLKISRDFTHGNAIYVTDNASLEAVHVQGALKEDKNQRMPYENLNNVLLIASEKTRKMSIKNSIIESGRYNLVIRGRAYEDEPNKFNPSLFEIEDVKFNAALVSAINIDNAQEVGFRVQSSDVRVKNLSFEWASAGIILQNGSNMRGWAKLTVLEKDRIDLESSLDMKDNWRNLEEAYGVLKAFNANDIVRDIIKKYPDAFAYEKPYYYVAMLIIKRGGGDNQSEIEVEDKFIKDNFVEVIKVPSSIEALHEKIGGREPFRFYCLNNELKPTEEEGK